MLNIKQITQDEALKLVTEGTEVMVMTPGTNGCDWKEMMPDTLQSLLSGLMYFKKEDPYAPAETADEAAEGEETPPPLAISKKALELMKSLPIAKQNVPPAVWTVAAGRGRG